MRPSLSLAVVVALGLPWATPSRADDKGAPFPLKGPVPKGLLTVRAEKAKLDLDLQERGWVVPVAPHVVVCPAKGRSLVKSRAALGREVKKGDLLVELDGEPLRE